MNPSPTVAKIKYVGLDVHAETIAVALADSLVADDVSRWPSTKDPLPRTQVRRYVGFY